MILIILFEKITKLILKQTLSIVMSEYTDHVAIYIGISLSWLALYIIVNLIWFLKLSLKIK